MLQANSPTGNPRRIRIDPPHSRNGKPIAASSPGPYIVFKSVIDRILAVCLLALSSPVILVAMAVVKLTSRGPALYTQVRVGRNGREFVIYKIRTMTTDSEKKSGPCWCKPNDPRITPIGRILRSTHIDELPQLWNVIRGDMSLVGPRPERPEFMPELVQAVPHYRDRLQVRPGMTGLAQVQLPPDTDISSVRRKLAYDLYYVRNCSLFLDLQILLATLSYLLRIPFALSQRMLRIPSGRIVEESYEGLAAQASAFVAVTARPKLRSV